MRGDGGGVVAVPRHGGPNLVVVHVLAVEQARSRFRLEALEERQFLVLVPPVEQEDSGDEDQERGAANRACNDVTFRGAYPVCSAVWRERGRYSTEDSGSLPVNNSGAYGRCDSSLSSIEECSGVRAERGGGCSRV